MWARYRLAQPAEQLPVTSDPAVLAACVGEVTGGIVVIYLDVGHQTRTRIGAFYEIVAEKRVLWKPAVRGLLKGIDIVNTLSGETPLTE